MTTEYWDLFPAAPDQKEFLFQVSAGNARANNSRLSFRIVLQGDEIVIVKPVAAAKGFLYGIRQRLLRGPLGRVLT